MLNSREGQRERAPFSLPFSGRAESFQLFGLGRMDAARNLCTAAHFTPVAFEPAARALVRLSVLRWTSSPVGPYVAAFVGLAVRRGSSASIGVPAGSASGAAVLSAFLRAPPLLFVPSYTVSDMPGGPAGCAAESRSFGLEALGMRKTPACFTANTRGGVTHLQALEHLAPEGGRQIVSGFSFSFARRGAQAPARRIPSPGLLCREVVREAGKAWLRGGASSALLFPSARAVGATVSVNTHFVTRPRLLDLASAHKVAFTPLVLDRPAPCTALGAVLEALDFEPRVLAWDPDLHGSIESNVLQPEEARA